MTRRFLRVVLASVVLLVLQGLLAFLVPAAARTTQVALGGALASAALTAALLTELTVRLRARGMKAALVLWLVWGGIQANSLVETLLFDIGVSRGTVARLALYLLAVSAAFSVFLALAFARKPAPEAEAGGARSAWWLLVTPLLYVPLYFAAGVLVWPYVRDFYQARPMPGGAAVLAVQVARGLVFGSIVLLLVRQLRGSRAAWALTAGLTLSVLGGVAPLLVSNPFMPEAVRMAHLPEVGISNFLFGFAAGWLLGRPRPGSEPAEVARPALEPHAAAHP